MMTTTTANGLSPQQLEQFHRDGYVVARQLFSPAEIAEIRETFSEIAKNGPVEGLSDIPGGRVNTLLSNDPLARFPRMMHPHRHLDKPVGPVAAKYMLHPVLHPILKTLFGEEPLAVQSMYYFKPPGARGQELHQDNFYLRVKPGTCMAAWVAIDDADEENGGMMAVPGTAGLDIACPEKADPTQSFSADLVAPPPGTRPVMVNMKSGDVMFFNGSVIHGSKPNTSKTRFRRSFICHYVPISTTELSHWYTNPTSFTKEVYQFKQTSDGGPCGTPHDNVPLH